MGNTSASSTASATAKVDTSAPAIAASTPTAVTGSANQFYDGGTKTLYFRPSGSGSFTLNATSSDAQSGVTPGQLPRRLRYVRLERLHGR